LFRKEFSERLEKQLNSVKCFDKAWFPERKVKEIAVYLEHFYKAC